MLGSREDTMADYKHDAGQPLCVESVAREMGIERSDREKRLAAWESENTGKTVVTHDGIECVVTFGWFCSSWLILTPTAQGRRSDAYLSDRRMLGDDFTIHPEIGSDGEAYILNQLSEYK